MAIRKQDISYASDTPALGDLDLISKCRILYTESKSIKRRFYEDWRRNYLLVNNRMWSDLRSNWMPSPTDPEILPILSQVIGYMTDQQIVPVLSPQADPNSPFSDQVISITDDLTTLLSSNFHTLRWGQKIKLSLWDAILYGSGILKTYWNHSLYKGMGDADVYRVDPWDFYPDPNSHSEHDAEYFIETKRMTIEEIERRFPDTSRSMLKRLREGADEYSDERPRPTNSVRRPMAQPGALPGGSGVYGLPGQSRLSEVQTMGIQVYECWLRQNHRTVEPITPNPNLPKSKQPSSQEIVYDEWRVVIYAGSTVLMDELASDLYDESKHPYTRFVFEDIGEFWGMPLCSHLAPAQIAINRLLASLQSNAELVGNPIFMEPKNSGINRTQIVNRPGSRLRIDNTASGTNTPQWLTPPSMPDSVSNLVQFWIGRMENISGISGVTKGQTPASGRHAQSTVQSAQESSFVRIRSALQNLEISLEDSFTLLASLIANNYTEPRIVAIVGQDGQRDAALLRSRHFHYPILKKGRVVQQPLSFTIAVDAGADTPTSRQARISEADTLFAMGAIDQQAVLEVHRYPHWQIIKARMEQAAKAQQEQLLEDASMGIKPPAARVRAKRHQ
ncbi:MAG: portal protein [Candidatus Micrarchaeaceae archaeon]